MKYNPKEDGLTHLNVYSKANTKIGRLLTNFAHIPIDTIDGHFESIEGYWGWLGISESNPKREQFRYLYGFQAKKLKTDLFSEGDVGRFDDRFNEKIAMAVHQKFQNPYMRQQLQENRHLLSLPIVHYYYFGTIDNPKVIDVTAKYPEFIGPLKEEVKKFLEEN